MCYVSNLNINTTNQNNLQIVIKFTFKFRYYKTLKKVLTYERNLFKFKFLQINDEWL